MANWTTADWAGSGRGVVRRAVGAETRSTDQVRFEPLGVGFSAHPQQRAPTSRGASPGITQLSGHPSRNPGAVAHSKNCSHVVDTRVLPVCAQKVSVCF